MTVYVISGIDDLCKGSTRLCRLSVIAIISRLYIVPCLHQFRLSKPTRHEIVVKILKYSKPSLISLLCVFKDVRAKTLYSIGFPDDTVESKMTIVKTYIAQNAFYHKSFITLYHIIPIHVYIVDVDLLNIRHLPRIFYY